MRVSNLLSANLLNGVFQQVAAASERRVAIIFTCSGGGGSNVVLSTATIGTGQYQLVLSSSTPIELTYERHGDIVRQAWFAAGAGGASTIGVLTTEEE